MNISGIRTSSGFYDYNTIKNNEVKIRQDQEIKEVEALELQEFDMEESGKQLISAAEEKMHPSQGVAEYARVYQPEAVYELKGADSELADLDVERAISDMKKDQVLQQYQFFIGESQAGEDLKRSRENENFTI